MINFLQSDQFSALNQFGTLKHNTELFTSTQPSTSREANNSFINNSISETCLDHAFIEFDNTIITDSSLFNEITTDSSGEDKLSLFSRSASNFQINRTKNSYFDSKLTPLIVRVNDLISDEATNILLCTLNYKIGDQNQNEMAKINNQK